MSGLVGHRGLLLGAGPNGHIVPFYPTVCYSMRRRRAAYAGACIRVRRSSDNAEQDIGFDAIGWCDIAALATFAGSDSCYVTTWYDQGTAARHLVQATSANQPRIVSAGVIDTLNSRPAMVFDGANDYLAVTANAELGFGTGAWTLEFYGVRTNSTTPDRVLADLRPAGGANTAGFFVRYQDGTGDQDKMYMYNGTTFLGAVIANGTLYHFAWSYVGGAASALRSFLAGAMASLGNATLDFTSSRSMTLGSNVVGAANWPGQIVEMLATKGSTVYTAGFTPRDIYADS